MNSLHFVNYHHPNRSVFYMSKESKINPNCFASKRHVSIKYAVKHAQPIMVSPSQVPTHKSSINVLSMKRCGTNLVLNQPSFHRIPIKSSKRVLKSPSQAYCFSTPPTVQSGLPPDARIYTVKIESNYGHKSKVSISSLNFLDAKRNPIPVSKIYSVPYFPDSNLESLANEFLLKEKNESWSAPFNGIDPISVIFYISSEFNPSFLRIWNPRDDLEASARKIEISLGRTVCYTGEAPRGFGVDVPIEISQVPSSNSTALLYELFPHLAPQPGVSDLHGDYPLMKVKKIKLIVLRTWAGFSSSELGLNGIDLFDHQGMMIPWDDIDDVNIEGCKNFQNIDKMMISSERGSRKVASEMFHAEVRNWEAQKPAIEIVFKMPVRITRIDIFNYCVADRSLKYGIKDFTIRVNGKLFMSRRLLMASFINSDPDVGVPIWFTDVPTLHKSYEYGGEEETPIKPEEETNTKIY